MVVAKATFGTTLTRNGNVVGSLTSIGGVELTQEFEDGTTHESADAFREKVGTVFDAGNVPIEGYFEPGDADGQLGLMADMAARTLQTFVMTFPAELATTWTFTALITKWKIGDAPIDGLLPFEAELEISGKPVLAVTASTGLTTPFFTVSGAGTLIVPAAAGAVYTYVADIGTAITSVTITPTATAGVITITANGTSQVVTSGAASSAITLGAAGSIVTATISVKEAGKVAKTYTVHLTRATA